MFCRHYFYVVEVGADKRRISGTVVAPLLAVFPGKAAMQTVENTLSTSLKISKSAIFFTVFNVI